jgi:methyl-accepting chemotaxis protein
VLNNLTIGVRLLLIIAGALLGMAAVGGVALVNLDSNLMADRQEKTRHLVESARSLVEHFAGLADAGAMTEEEARTAALAAVRDLRYDGEEYFFVLDDRGTMLMHPFNRDIVGEDVRGFADPNGLRLFAEMIAVARRDGAGFVAYEWPKAGATEPQPKVSYVAAFDEWGWVIGSGIYVDDVAAVFWENAEIIGGLGIVLLALVGGMAVMVGRGISGPIARISRRMDALAGGNLQVDVPHTEYRDEVGALARSLQVFKDSAVRMEEMRREQEEAERRAAEDRRAALMQMADRLEASVKTIVGSVGDGCTELRATSQSLNQLAEQANSRAQSVAAGSQEASANVQTVAAATEELTGSIGEIGQQVSHSAEIARQAVSSAERTEARVSALTEAADKIGQVVQLINTIAEQTNLLALNATIEAARAGEAGKGFAVVASEVKNLANQTAKATDEIAGQVQAMQGATGDTAAAIGEIGGVIKQIDEIAAAIAAAVEEQGSATHEIARNVEEAAHGTQTVAGNIAGVSEAAEQTGTAAGEVRTVAASLAEQSETLRREIDSFLAQVRAG